MYHARYDLSLQKWTIEHDRYGVVQLMGKNREPAEDMATALNQAAESREAHRLATEEIWAVG